MTESRPKLCYGRRLRDYSNNNDKFNDGVDFGRLNHAAESATLGKARINAPPRFNIPTDSLSNRFCLLRHFIYQVAASPDDIGTLGCHSCDNSRLISCFPARRPIARSCPVFSWSSIAMSGVGFSERVQARLVLSGQF